MRTTKLTIFISALMFAFMAVPAASGHDLKLAYFEISKDTQGYHLQINCDKGDLYKCLAGSFRNLAMAADTPAWQNAVRVYINTHLKIKLDGQPAAVKIESFDHDDNYVRMSCRLTAQTSAVKTITVYNTCFTESIKGYKNIVHATLYNRTRSFRLDEDREEIVIAY